jgi:hypothetical protein
MCTGEEGCSGSSLETLACNTEECTGNFSIILFYALFDFNQSFADSGNILNINSSLQHVLFCFFYFDNVYANSSGASIQILKYDR